QARLNKNRNFNSYWIHHNISEQRKNSLANIESGLIDLRFAPAGLSEQRWFVVKTADKSTAVGMTGEQAAALMRCAPASAQLVEAHGQTGASEELGAVISRALLGKLPDESATPPEAPDRTRSTSNNNDEEGRTERYNHLDTRFDVDVD